MVTIAESDQFKITYHHFNDSSDTILVSFDHIRSDIRDTGFGTDLCRNLGINNIYVAQRVGSQYQGLDIDTFYQSTQPYMTKKNTFSYGSSLGGYAALYFGGCINAKIIASAPINHAHSSISDPEFKNLQYNHMDLKQTILSKYPPIILFDPYQHLDVTFIKECVRPAYPNGTYLSYPFAGHTILETMKANGTLSKFIRRLIFDDVVENTILKQDGCPIYHAEVGRKYRYEGNYDAAEQELLTSINVRPSENAIGHLLWIYIETKNVTGMMALLCNVLSNVEKSKASRYIPHHTRCRIKKMGIDIDTILRFNTTST